MGIYLSQTWPHSANVTVLTAVRTFCLSYCVILMHYAQNTNQDMIAMCGWEGGGAGFESEYRAAIGGRVTLLLLRAD